MTLFRPDSTETCYKLMRPHIIQVSPLKRMGAWVDTRNEGRVHSQPATTEDLTHAYVAIFAE